MAGKAPGKSHRKGISILKLNDMFPDEASAVRWFEETRWPNGERYCGKCGSVNTREIPNGKPMPYWCGDCKSYFSVRTGTPIENSRLPLRKWAFAVYFYVTNLKGVSSMHLHRELDVTQKSAWYMLHRLRKGWDAEGLDKFIGPVEIDETHMGGKRKNKPLAKRRELKGRGPVDMTTVAGAKDRETNRVAASVVENTDAPTLQGFVREHVQPGATIYTDEARAYRGMPEFDHEAVNHSISEYVRGMVSINGMESFWNGLKRGLAIYHKMSPKHLQRYVDEFAGRHNVRDADTIDQVTDLVASMVGKRLMYRDLIAENGRSSGARS